MASTYLTRTQTAGNRRTWTWSGWIKRGVVDTRQNILSAGIDGNDESQFRFDATGYLRFKESTNNSAEFLLDTNALFRDSAAWYHFVIAVDTTQSTDSDRIKIYVNGSQITSFNSPNYPSQNYETRWNNNSQATYLGLNVPAYPDYFNGYMAHVHFTDGYAYAASTFGSTATNGQWVPNLTPSVTYGTNGYFLKFLNASDLGEDFSGNNNDFTKSGSGDKTLDSPENVFATLNPLYKQGSPTFSEGNTKVVLPAGDGTQGAAANFAPPTGKWYWEIKQGSSTNSSIMVREASDKEDDISYYQGSYAGYELNDGNQNVTGNTTSVYGAAYADGDIIMVALDMDNNRVYFGKNGLWADGAGNSNQSSLNDYVPLNGVTNGVPAVTNANGSASATFQFNFGNPAFSITSGNADGNGKGNFEYAPPTNYLALCTDNLSSALTQPIGKGGSYFNTLIWSGDNTTRNFTGVGFSPDWVWIKSRSDGTGQVVYDSVRGNGKQLQTQNSDAELTNPQFGYVSSFDSDGFTTTPGTYSGYESGNVNMSGRTYVGWNWRGSDSSAVTNTDGSITSTVSANTTAGFSIVTYNLNTSGAQTVGHGLSKPPEFIINKGRDYASAWWVFTTVIDGSLDYIQLDGTGAKADDTIMSLPTSTTFGQVSNYTLQQNVVSYCFHSVEGYSKIGKYTGNGSTDGAFVYTGFRPAWVMIKRTDSANDWFIQDNKRLGYNPNNSYLEANTTLAEQAETDVDILSNGFKLRSNGGGHNASGGTYIYMAFAENPFVDSSGVPANAR
jgi:hypothetical protein